MAIKRLALAALCTLGLSSPALAEPTLSQWVNAIDRAGVQRRISDNCESRFYAIYHHHTNTITLCDSAFSNEQILLETIAHEAIHAAQHCLALRHDRRGLMSFIVGMRLWDRQKADATEQIVREGLYYRDIPREDYGDNQLIEYEAYYYESDPDLAMKMLLRSCTNE